MVSKPLRVLCIPQTKQKPLPLLIWKSCKCSSREKTVNFKQTTHRQKTGREKRNRKENSTSKKKQICYSRRLFLTKIITKALPTIASESHHGKTRTDPMNKKDRNGSASGEHPWADTKHSIAQGGFFPCGGRGAGVIFS